jgi:hypothetical protein
MKQLITLQKFTLNIFKKTFALPSFNLCEYLFELLEIAKLRYDCTFSNSATIALVSYYFYDRFIKILVYEGHTNQLFRRKLSISARLFNEKKMPNFTLLVNATALIGKDRLDGYGNCIGCRVSGNEYFEKQFKRNSNRVNFWSASTFSLNTNK